MGPGISHGTIMATWLVRTLNDLKAALDFFFTLTAAYIGGGGLSSVLLLVEEGTGCILVVLFHLLFLDTRRWWLNH